MTKNKYGKRKEFRFSRLELLIIILLLYVSPVIFGLATIPNYYIIFIWWALLSPIAIFGLLVYSDVYITKDKIEVIYLGWYLLRLDYFRKRIPFKEIKKVKNRWNVNAIFNNMLIVGKKDSALVYYTHLKGGFDEFKKAILSRVPKDCEIIGFKYTKKGELIS